MSDEQPGTSRPALSGRVVLARADIGHRSARFLPEAIARQEQVVPINRTGAGLDVASLVASAALVERVATAAACPVRLFITCDPLDLAYGMEAVYGPFGRGEHLREEAIASNLVRLGHLHAGSLPEAARGRSGNLNLTAQLFEDGRVSPEAIAEATALTLQLPYVRLGTWPVRMPLVRLLPREIAEANDLVPIALYRGRLIVALAHPNALVALKGMPSVGFSVAPVVASRSAIRSTLRIAWGTAPEHAEEGDTISALAGPALAGQAASPGSAGHDRPVQSSGPGNAPPSVRARRALATALALLPSTRRNPPTLLDRVAGLRVNPDIAYRLPGTLVQALGGLPLREQGRTVLLAVRAPLDHRTRELYRMLLGQRVAEVVLEESVHQRLLERWSSETERTPTLVWPENWWAHEETFDAFLFSLGYVTPEQADAVQRRDFGGQLALRRYLVDRGILTEDAVAEALGLWLGIPSVRVEQWVPDPEAVRRIPREFARRHAVLPLSCGGSGLLVAASSPDSPAVREELETVTGLTVFPCVAGRSAVGHALRRWYRDDRGVEASAEFIRVTEALLREGGLTAAQRAYLAETCLRSNETPDRAAVRLGWFSEEQFAQATATALDMPCLGLTPQERFVPGIDPLGRAVTLRRVLDPVEAFDIHRMTEQQARAAAAMPVRREKGRLVVAFAWPSADHIATLQVALDEEISPAVAPRSQIDAAISRRLGRPRLGDTLLATGLVRPDQLETAAGLAQRSGLRLGEALVSLGYVSEIQLAAHLAEQYDLPFFDLQRELLDPEVAGVVPKGFSSERQVLPISRAGGELLLATVDPLDRDAFAEVERITGLRVRPVLVTPSQFAATYQELFREENIAFSASDLMTRSPEDSASRVLSDGQKAAGLGALVFAVLMFAWQPIGFLTSIVILTNFFYLTISFYKFYLIAKALGHSLEIATTSEEVAALDERDLPVYTILVPLYRETEVLPTLVEAIGRLDYPKAKLDVKLLLEEDDTETIRVARASRLPSHFQIVVVPHGRPKGKPKACNYGLLHARGTLTVIFDAEDVPDPDQLKKVVIAFRKGGPKLGCVQCKLNYYNQDQNLLTRWFTSEYSMWFDLFLPGLDATRAPIPLGGTSNHFPTIVLQELGAWDPYNVTEDADLGIRLFKRGYNTAVVDSTTYEEANSELYNWIRQRSRWVKGYIQTWLVHMRHPVTLYRAIGFQAFFSIQMTIFGTFFTFLVNPIFWAMTATWFLFHWGLISELFPGPIFYVGAVSLFLGNFIFTYMTMMGCIYRGYYGLVKYAVLVPLYWYLMSFAAWKGFVQLFWNPFYWEKTVHGLYRGQVLQGGPGAGATPGKV